MKGGKILYAHQGQQYVIKLIGQLTLHDYRSIDEFFLEHIKSLGVQDLLVDLENMQYLDSTGLGLLVRLAQEFQQHRNKQAKLVCRDPKVLHLLNSMCLNKIYSIVSEHKADLVEYFEMELAAEDEKSMGERSLRAHKALSELSSTNKDRFAEVVMQLEKDLRKP